MDMEKVLARITEADDLELTALADAIMRRQKQLHPDWEGVYISFPLKWPEECKQILLRTWEILRETMKECKVER